MEKPPKPSRPLVRKLLRMGTINNYESSNSSHPEIYAFAKQEKNVQIMNMAKAIN